MPKPKYEMPFVDCAKHGKQAGYVVCLHVLHGDPVAQVDPPTERMVGEISCGRPESYHDVDALELICEQHAKEMGLLKPR